jgi:hypothetical protein
MKVELTFFTSVSAMTNVKEHGSRSRPTDGITGVHRATLMGSGGAPRPRIPGNRVDFAVLKPSRP